MGMIDVIARRPGVKKGEVCGYFDDRRIYQFEKFQISDEPLKNAAGEPIPGTIAAFSDNKRKALHPGWMEFVNPEDEKKFRATAPKAAPAPVVKGKGEISDAERADFEAWKAEKAKAAKGTGDKEPSKDAPPAKPAGKGAAKGTGDKDVI